MKVREMSGRMMCSLCFIFFGCVTSPVQRTVNVLHNSEQPATSFGILDTGTSLVADHLFDCLMNKLKGVYQQKKGFKIEARGQRYELGDFIIKIGSVSMGPNFRGLLFEVKS